MKLLRNACTKHPDSPLYVSGSTRRCRDCGREQSRQWAASHHDQHLANSRKHHRDKKAKVRARKRRYYAANPDKAARALETSKQAGYRKWRGSANYEHPHNGICPICTKEKLLVYDHCHETGAFRGWVCNNCNRGLGYFGDSVAGIQRALVYLQGS